MGVFIGPFAVAVLWAPQLFLSGGRCACGAASGSGHLGACGVVFGAGWCVACEPGLASGAPAAGYVEQPGRCRPTDLRQVSVGFLVYCHGFAVLLV